MKQEPTVQKFMTTQPHVIGADSKLKDAIELIDKYEIHHLPVLESGKCLSVLSRGDIDRVKGIEGVNPETLSVKDICSHHPCSVSANTPLSQVCEMMSDYRMSSVVVEENSKVVGIFTHTDLCQAMINILHTRFHS